MRKRSEKGDRGRTKIKVMRRDGWREGMYGWCIYDPPKMGYPDVFMRFDILLSRVKTEIEKYGKNGI